MAVCTLCGGLAPPLTRPRAEATPLGQLLKRVPLFALSKEGLVAMVLGGAFMALGRVAGVVVWAVAAGVVWGYLFSIIRSTASGEDRIGVPEFRDAYEDVLAPAVRGLVGIALILLPALLHFVLGRRTGELFPFADPATWLLLLLGLSYAPMALVAAATDVSVIGMLNPAGIVGYIRRVGWDYARVIGALVPLFVLGIVLHRVSELALQVRVPFLALWLAESVRLYVPFTAARILGILLYLRGYALDWGSPQDYRTPRLGPILPRGHWVRPDQIPPEELLAAGREAARNRNFPLALRNLMAAAAASHPAVTPAALVSLAQVHGDGFKNRVVAKRLYREAVERYPDSEAARYAAAKLEES